jgi:hypothetical protein
MEFAANSAVAAAVAVAVAAAAPPRPPPSVADASMCRRNDDVPSLFKEEEGQYRAGRLLLRGPNTQALLLSLLLVTVVVGLLLLLLLLLLLAAGAEEDDDVKAWHCGGAAVVPSRSSGSRGRRCGRANQAAIRGGETAGGG